MSEVALNQATSGKGVSLRARATAFVVAAVTAVTVPSVAFASVPPVEVPADPTGGQLAASQDWIQTFVLTYGVPVLFGLTLLGIGIKIGRRWMRKAGGSV